MYVHVGLTEEGWGAACVYGKQGVCVCEKVKSDLIKS